MRKTIILLSAVAVITASAARAQGARDELRHECAVSIGILSNTQVTLMGNDLYDIHSTCPLSAEYFYHIRRRLSIGCVAVYEKTVRNHPVEYEPVDVTWERDSHYTLLPAALRVHLLRTRHFGLYTKAALGLTLRRRRSVYDTPVRRERRTTRVFLNGQFTPLGLEGGTPDVRLFVELGAGQQGIGLTGLRYIF